jgi:hypothetical protein
MDDLEWEAVISLASLVRPGRCLRVAWLLALPLIFAGTASGEVKERLAGVHIPFIANAGQADPAVAYYAQTFAGTVFVTRNGRVVYSLPGGKAPASNRRAGWSLTERPVGGKASPIGTQCASTNVSYFVGNDRSRWRSGLETFEGVSLGEVWPGIRLELRARGKNVEKLFTVEPGGDPTRIRIRLKGQRSLRIRADGALVVKADLGKVTFTPPVAYQERQGLRHPVRVAYRLRGKEYGFRLGDHDPGLPVIIDPLLQGTYLDGNGNDYATSLAIHPTSSDIYVAGYAPAGNFLNHGVEAFVARLNSSLTALTQVTYLGGRGDDLAQALAIDPTSGDVYVAGSTSSTNFSGTTGGAQAVNSGGNDAFVARLSSSLTTLKQATYLGGSGGDVAQALAIHPTSSDVYVAGYTGSKDFPGTLGGAQATGGGAFVARLSSSLTTLTQATYLGGSRLDVAQALAIHPTSGDVYVAGYTSSTDFPGTTGGAQAFNSGGSGVFGPARLDAFVARLSSSLTTLIQATYLGGSGDDIAYALAIRPTSDDVYVAGSTASRDFPGTTGGTQAANGGNVDAFVARLSSSLTFLTQATYLGGSGNDSAQGLAIHSTSGDVYVAGYTTSPDLPATKGAARAGYRAARGGNDAFVARLTGDPLAAGPCSADSTSLCLNAGRFKVQTQWMTSDGMSGAGQAVSLTTDTGYFWFFSPDNVEVIVKVVSGCGFNSRIWTFAAGLTDVNVVMTVTDAQTGAVKTYVNPQGTAFAPIQDTSAFAVCSTTPETGLADASEPVEGLPRTASAAIEYATAACTANATTLCLNDGRFRVQTQWTTTDGKSGSGQAVLTTPDTGYFWFFSPNNVEVIVKVVSGCGLNSRYWTFAGGLTDAKVVMTVTDTRTGALSSYINPQGVAFQPIQDTSAFATCP